MTDRSKPLAPVGSSGVDAFVKAARDIAPAAVGAHGRLIFAMDATLSREHAWDVAARVQGRMFDAARSDPAGQPLSVQLVYYRGYGECRASSWTTDPARLRALMGKVRCEGGATQIERVFAHARTEAAREPVAALVFVGDALEEPVDAICAGAGALGLAGVKIFMFQEGHDPMVERGFREAARLSGGAWARFDSAAPDALAALMRAVARYASGGRAGLARLAAAGDDGARLLAPQMRG